MPHIELSDQDAQLLRQVLETKLTDLQREESHTDSPRFRAALYDLDGAIQRVLAQLPVLGSAAAAADRNPASRT